MSLNRLKQYFHKTAEDAGPLVLDDFIIRQENPGVIMDDHGDKTRATIFVLVAMFVPDAHSVHAKISWIRDNWDWVQLRAKEFLRNYIITYFKDPLDDYIGLKSMELLDDDPATRRSLSKAAFLVISSEVKHGVATPAEKPAETPVEKLHEETKTEPQQTQSPEIQKEPTHRLFGKDRE